MKKVSIVIPTRNKAHLLKSALKSALEQTYPDLEIIVCDNYSSDNTAEVAASFKSEKIVYVKTEKSLSMPDNWEFALSKASGEYVTYLTDDAYLLPHCISKAVEELEKFNAKVVVWKHAAYFSPDWVEPGRKNVLYIPKATSRSYVIDSRASLEKFFDIDEGISLPVMIPQFFNSLCHKSIIDKIISIQGRFFLPPCAGPAASILLNTKEYLFIDQPLLIDGVTTSSISATMSFNLGRSAQSYIDDFNQKLEDIFFWGIPTFPAAVAKHLESVRKFYLNTCPEINKKTLLNVIADRLMKLESNGINVRDYWQMFNKNLSRQPLGIRLAVLKQKFLSKIKWLLVKKIRSSSLLERLEALRNINILRGEEWNFNNIEEAAEVLVSKKVS